MRDVDDPDGGDQYGRGSTTTRERARHRRVGVRRRAAEGRRRATRDAVGAGVAAPSLACRIRVPNASIHVSIHAVATRVADVMETWTPEEDTALFNGIACMGHTWKLIRLSKLPHRTVASIRNRYQRIAAGQMRIGRNRCRRCGQLRRGCVCMLTNDAQRLFNAVVEVMQSRYVTQTISPITEQISQEPA